MSLSLQGKQLAAFVTNDRIQAFEQELGFWETGLHHYELDSFPVLGGFSDEAGMTLTNAISWDVLTFEDVQNTVKRYFPDDQCAMLRNDTWVTHPLKEWILMSQERKSC